MGEIFLVGAVIVFIIAMLSWFLESYEEWRGEDNE